MITKWIFCVAIIAFHMLCVLLFHQKESFACDLEIRYVDGAGLGVFAGPAQSFIDGSYVQRVKTIPLPLPMLYNSALLHYVDGFNATHAVITTGHAMLFNHHSTPLVHLVWDEQSNEGLESTSKEGRDVIIQSLSPISPGQQIFRNYGEDWFPVRGLQEQSISASSVPLEDQFQRNHDEHGDTAAISTQEGHVMPGCATLLVHYEGGQLTATQNIAAGDIIEVTRAILIPESSMLQKRTSPVDDILGDGNVAEEVRRTATGTDTAWQDMEGVHALQDALWWKMRTARSIVDNRDSSGSHAYIEEAWSNFTSAHKSANCHKDVSELDEPTVPSSDTINRDTRDSSRTAALNTSSAYTMHSYDGSGYTDYAVVLLGYGSFYTASTTTSVTSSNSTSSTSKSPPQEDMVLQQQHEANVDYDWWDFPTATATTRADDNTDTNINSAVAHCDMLMMVSFTARRAIAKGELLVVDLMEGSLSSTGKQFGGEGNGEVSTTSATTGGRRRRYVHPQFAATCL